jgi:hypothetical protein
MSESTGTPARDPAITEAINRIAFTCRGPRDADVERVLARLVRLQTTLAQPCVVARTALGADATTGQLIAHLLGAGLKAEAAAVDAASRTPCGATLNPVILAQPLDGQDHSAPCPACGNTFAWTAPDYGEGPAI